MIWILASALAVVLMLAVLEWAQRRSAERDNRFLEGLLDDVESSVAEEGEEAMFDHVRVYVTRDTWDAVTHRHDDDV